MTEYEVYVNSINKVFELTDKMKKNWDSKDNQYIEQIIEYKQKIIDTSKIVQEKHSKKVMSKELVGEE